MTETSRNEFLLIKKTFPKSIIFETREKGVVDFFKRKFDFTSIERTPKFSDIDRRHNLDIELAASGFSKQIEQEIEAFEREFRPLREGEDGPEESENEEEEDEESSENKEEEKKQDEQPQQQPQQEWFKLEMNCLETSTK